MARKVIHQTLKPQVGLKYVNKVWKELHKEEDIYELCQRISEVLDVEYEMQQHTNNRS